MTSKRSSSQRGTSKRKAAQRGTPKRKAAQRPPRRNWKAEADALNGHLCEISRACGLGVVTYAEIVEAVRVLVGSKDNALNELTRCARDLSELKERHERLVSVDNRLQARNKGVAVLLRDAEAIIGDFAALMPVGAQHHALQERRSMASTGYRDGGFAALGTIGEQVRTADDIARDQSDALGGEALRGARRWRERMAELAATNPADREDIPF